MYGLVLEGGGAKGAYHVGAYKALMELGVEIGGIAGTSIGALNGALLVQGDLEKLEDIWVNTKSSDLFNIDEKALNDLRNFNLQEINLPYILSVSKDILSNGGLDITKIRELLEEYIDEDAIRKSSLDFGIVTVKGIEYQIMDIGMRMLKPHELFKAQGFPDNYIIDRDSEGNPYPTTEQVAKCGNSVCPPLAKAIVEANYKEKIYENIAI